MLAAAGVLGCGCRGAAAPPPPVAAQAAPPTTVVAGTLTRPAPDQRWVFTTPDDRRLPLPPRIDRQADAVAGAERTELQARLVLREGPAGLTVDDWRCIAISTACSPALPEPGVLLFGTEPFWSVQLQDGAARWTLLDPAQTLELRALPGTEPGHWRLEPDGGGETWLLEIRPQPCSDGMSDALWSHTVVLDKPDGSLHGCARVPAAPLGG